MRTLNQQHSEQQIQINLNKCWKNKQTNNESQTSHDHIISRELFHSTTTTTKKHPWPIQIFVVIEHTIVRNKATLRHSNLTPLGENKQPVIIIITMQEERHNKWLGHWKCHLSHWGDDSIRIPKPENCYNWITATNPVNISTIMSEHFNFTEAIRVFSM